MKIQSFGNIHEREITLDVADQLIWEAAKLVANRNKRAEVSSDTLDAQFDLFGRLFQNLEVLRDFGDTTTLRLVTSPLSAAMVEGFLEYENSHPGEPFNPFKVEGAEYPTAFNISQIIENGYRAKLAAAAQES